MFWRIFLIVGSTFVLAAAMVSGAAADIYTLDIPDPNGVSYLDFGTSFSSINSVKLKCSGWAVFGVYMDQEMNLRDFYPKVVIDIWDDPRHIHQGSSIVDTAGEFSNFELDMAGPGPNSLMDGRATVRMRYGSVALYPFYALYSSPSITYSSARLTIDGVPVSIPEPGSMTSLLCGLGLLGSARGSWRRMSTPRTGIGTRL